MGTIKWNQTVMWGVYGKSEGVGEQVRAVRLCLAAPNGVQAEGVSQQEVQESVLGPAEAEEHFAKVVQKGEAPEEIRECPISFNRFREFLMQIGQAQAATTPNIRSAVNMNRLLVEIGLAKSHSEAGRLIAQDAVEIDGEKLTSNVASVKDIFIIKVGKRRFAKVINTDTE